MIKKILFLLLLISVSILVCACMRKETAQSSSSSLSAESTVSHKKEMELAQDFLESLVSGDYESAGALCSEEAGEQLPPSVLGAVMSQLEQMYGAPTGDCAISSVSGKSPLSCKGVIEFAGAQLQVTVSVQGEQVTGFFQTAVVSKTVHSASRSHLLAA